MTSCYRLEGIRFNRKFIVVKQACRKDTKVLRALCDHLLSGEATALDVAYRLASLIDAIEGRSDRPTPRRCMH